MHRDFLTGRTQSQYFQGMTSTPRQRPKDPLDHEPEAVEYARRQAGLTQQQLADMCGVGRSLITEIELGTRNATPAMLIKLARALNCPRVILERKREPETASPTNVDVQPVPDTERGVAPDLPEMRRDVS